MTISTYSELQTAVQIWLDRSDLSVNAADFITLAESRLNRILPLRFARTTAGLTGTPGLANLVLPSDFVEPYALFLTTFGVKTELKPFVFGTIEQGTVNGVPSAWSVVRAVIALDCPCDQAHTFEFVYRQSLTLSDSAPTNWLLTNHPDVYLLASLVEAAFFAENLDYMALCKARLDEAIAETTAKEGRSLGVATLSVDAGLAALSSAGPNGATPSFNINTD
jgi:hypothetical protein